MSLLERARAYLRAIETRQDVEPFFAADVVQTEFPNRLVPNGATRDRAALMQANERGRQVLTGERYEIVHGIESGPDVALEVVWIGTLAVPVGTLAAGATMRAHFAVFPTFRDGRIVAQRNYDCFDPF